MTKRPWLNREVFGWAMFDFANQAFTLVILTAMYQVYFINQVVVENERLGRQLWATSGIIALTVVIATSPVIGALADFSGAKKKLLFVTYVACVGFTSSLALVQPGWVAAGMVLFIVGYIFYATGENFLASFLPELARHRDMGKVSAFGWTLGYIGGLLCLGGAVAITAAFSESARGYQVVMLWAAIFFCLSGIPTFVLLRERKQAEKLPQNQTMWTIGFARLGETFRTISGYRHLFRFLAIMTFYLAGMQIVIWFAGTITKELFDFSSLKMGLFLLQITVTAIIGAVVTGYVQDRIGTRNTIHIALVMWALVMIGAAFVTSETVFWILANGVGIGMGGLGTASRSMVGLFSPPHKAAEFFGFYGLAGKVAIVLGLGLTILTEEVFPENYNLVVASSSIFFLGGIALLFTVDEKAGRIAALRSGRAHVREFHDFKGRVAALED